MVDGFYRKEDVLKMLKLTFDTGFLQGLKAATTGLKTNPPDVSKFFDDFRDREREEFIKTIQKPESEVKE